MAKKNKRIYIAGKVSGEKPEEVFHKFLAAEEKLKADGWEPVNPVRHCGAEWPWEKCMRACVILLMGCDNIYLLKDWKRSRGARLERYIALKLGMRVTKE